MADSKRAKKGEKSGYKEEKDRSIYYRFSLFIAGDEPNSRIAKENLKGLLEKYLHGNYELEIIDVVKDYRKALEKKVFFAPTLVIDAPDFQSRIVGSLNDTKKLLDILGLSETEEDK